VLRTGCQHRGSSIVGAGPPQTKTFNQPHNQVRGNDAMEEKVIRIGGLGPLTLPGIPWAGRELKDGMSLARWNEVLAPRWLTVRSRADAP